MSTGRRIAAGAAWIYGSQLLTMAAQFLYAAITSRVVGDAQFGDYAIALSVGGFITLLAAGGLGQSVGRMVELEQDRLRSLMSYALLLGAGAAALLAFTAPFWSFVWGSSGALVPILWLTINAFTAPANGLTTGLLRRLGNFRAFSLITLTSNMIGMIVGAFSALHFQSASSLLVSPIVAQLLSTAAGWLYCGPWLRGLGRLSSARDDIRFSGNLTATAVMGYLVGNISKIGVSRVLGVSTLGQWNRAEVVSTVPFQQVQTALIQATYPEFRHHRANAERARVVWTDLLIFVAWAAIPASAVGAVVIPQFVPLLFGPGWELAQLLAGALMIAGGLQVVSTLLASAVESLGKFRWIWLTQCVLVAVQIAALVMLFVLHTVEVAVVALLVTNVVRHAIHISLCHRHGYVSGRRLVASYGQVAISAAIAAAVALGISWLVHQALTDNAAYWVAAGIVPASVVSALWLLRERLPPVLLARKYGLLGGR